MDDFRNTCLTLKSLILMSGMPLVQHLPTPTAVFHARLLPLHLTSCDVAWRARDFLLRASTSAFSCHYVSR